MSNTPSARVTWKPIASLFTLGTLDCITTVIGIEVYHLFEQNPLMNILISKSIWLFILVKMLSTISLVIVFYLSQNILNGIPREKKHLDTAYLIVYVALTAIIIFMFIVVFNNIYHLLIRW